MESLGIILEILKCVVPPVRKYVHYHRNLEKNKKDLEEKLNELNIQKKDIDEALEEQRNLGKRPNTQVKTWIKNVGKVDSDIKGIMQKVDEGRYVSRARLGKLVEEKIKEVEKYLDKIPSFTSLVFDMPPAKRTPPSTASMLPTTKLAGKGNEKIVEQIWNYLMSDEVKKIGVYGMAGVGKTTIMTHIRNKLEETNKFNHVIWVTVSQKPDVLKLQNNIATAVKQSLPQDEDKINCARKLWQMLVKEERYVLILDDVWKEFPLLEVGIPEPTEDNGCKLVITTRSSDVCRSMGCEKVKVQPLSNEDALNLFLDNVGRRILIAPDLEKTVYLVVRECAGLPLAIVNVAGKMRGKEEIHEWINALNELSGPVNSVYGLTDEVFGQLELSYNHLINETVQHCFLYCALYPEGHNIPKDELIDYWISEGFFDDMDNIEAKYARGYTILGRLANSCLLESADNGLSVKMHDLVRDMALRITSKSPLFLIKTGINLQKFPIEKEWKENLEKVSLMKNRISEIPSNMSPKCQTLSTLLLKRNGNLQKIPECFFVNMPGLKILDLSYTGIEKLPNSVSDLTNLKSLFLRHCDRLQRVPSLAKLLALQFLDLGKTGILEVPEGLEMLENLHYLNLYSISLIKFPAGIFPKLHRLFKLSVFWRDETLRETVEEAGQLSNQLGTFEGFFVSLAKFNIYAKFLAMQGPKRYRLVLCPRLAESGISRIRIGSQTGEEILVKFVRIEDCSICGREDPIVLPKDVQSLGMRQIYDLRSLNDVFSRDQEAYSSLKFIAISNCDKLKKLLSSQLVSVLQNLEIIEVSACKNLEEIIAFNVNDDEKEGNRKKKLGRNVISVTLPRLTMLMLKDLPSLKSICSTNSFMVCNSLQEIQIIGCHNLKRLSLSLPVDNKTGEPSPIPTLETIQTDRDIWESLEWDQPNIEKVLNQYCNFGRWA